MKLDVFDALVQKPKNVSGFNFNLTELEGAGQKLFTK